MDSTTDRIYGQLNPQKMVAESSHYGTGKNPADLLPTQGTKTKIAEKDIMQAAHEVLMQRERKLDALREERFFDTTSRSNFTQQDLSKNCVGRRQMKNQDGEHVGPEQRDEQLIVEHGTWRRAQKTSDQNLQDRIPVGDYTQTQPVTYWTHNQERKNYYMSAATGHNPFSRTSGLTQTADQTKGVNGFYGNIDFEKEASQVDFRKSIGKNMSQTNMYNQNDVCVSSFGDITGRVVEACKQQQPGNGLRALRVFLRKIDKQGDGLLDPSEFKFGMKAFGVEISEQEMNALLKYFDTSKCGRISLNEMLHAMRSNSLNECREKSVCAAYNKFDKNNNQTVTLGCLVDNYDPTINPQYQSGCKSGEQLLKEFTIGWDSSSRDCVVSLGEFMDYYKDVSPTICGDHVFENMIKNTWNL